MLHLAGFRSLLDRLTSLLRLPDGYLPSRRLREDEVEEEEGEGRHRGGDLEDLPVGAEHGDEGDDDLADGEGNLKRVPHEGLPLGAYHLHRHGEGRQK